MGRRIAASAEGLMTEKISFFADASDIAEIEKAASHHHLHFVCRRLLAAQDNRLLVRLEGDNLDAMNAGCAEIFKFVAPSSPSPSPIKGPWWERIQLTTARRF